MPHRPPAAISFRRARRQAAALALSLTAALLAGCGEDEQIRSYKVPKETRPANVGETKRPAVAELGKDARTLGAIFPNGETSWFFKIQAPKELVTGERKKEFEEFVRSVQLPRNPGELPQWKVPEGWEQGPRRSVYLATFRLGPKETPIEMTVSEFGGTVLGNVNRWRGEVGLDPLPEDRLKQETEQLNVNGIPVTLVDVSGKLAKKAGPMMGR